MKSKILIRANNWKKKHINNILKIRDDMIQNNINKIVIDNYVNEQYNYINEIYKQKISKDKINLDKKRENEIKNLIKSKIILENSGYNVLNYVNKRYYEINNDLNYIEFIDV
jgi:hypothetical protein